MTAEEAKEVRSERRMNECRMFSVVEVGRMEAMATYN